VRYYENTFLPENYNLNTSKLKRAGTFLLGHYAEYTTTMITSYEYIICTSYNAISYRIFKRQTRTYVRFDTRRCRTCTHKRVINVIYTSHKFQCHINLICIVNNSVIVQLLLSYCFKKISIICVMNN